VACVAGSARPPDGDSCSARPTQMRMWTACLLTSLIGTVRDLPCVPFRTSYGSPVGRSRQLERVPVDGRGVPWASMEPALTQVAQACRSRSHGAPVASHGLLVWSHGNGDLHIDGHQHQRDVASAVGSGPGRPWQPPRQSRFGHFVAPRLGVGCRWCSDCVRPPHSATPGDPGRGSAPTTRVVRSSCGGGEPPASPHRQVAASTPPRRGCFRPSPGPRLACGSTPAAPAKVPRSKGCWSGRARTQTYGSFTLMHGDQVVFPAPADWPVAPSRPRTTARTVSRRRLRRDDWSRFLRNSAASYRRCTQPAQARSRQAGAAAYAMVPAVVERGGRWVHSSMRRHDHGLRFDPARPASCIFACCAPRWVREAANKVAVSGVFGTRNRWPAARLGLRLKTSPTPMWLRWRSCWPLWEASSPARARSRAPWKPRPRPRRAPGRRRGFSAHSSLRSGHRRTGMGHLRIKIGAQNGAGCLESDAAPRTAELKADQKHTSQALPSPCFAITPKLGGVSAEPIVVQPLGSYSDSKGANAWVQSEPGEFWLIPRR